MITKTRLHDILAPQKTPFSKRRLGRAADGGYVLLGELFDASPAVYSYGIGGETSFDEDCCRAGKPVYMYDHTIDGPPVPMEGMTFCAEPFSEKFYEHVLRNGHQHESRMTLKLDVEGHEWNGLLDCDFRAFARFSQMVVEFHGMTGSQRQEVIFGRLLESFAVVHLHGNNHRGASQLCNGFSDVLEITFARRDCLPWTAAEDRPFPIAGIDFPNLPDKTDYTLDWWLA